jgi:superfamily I DNA/RNA helicase
MARVSTWFFGDTNQSLYKFNKNTLSMGQIANAIGIESPFQMEFNYRLPKKIARAVDKICNSDLEWYCIKEGEHLPEKIKCSNYNAQLDKIMEIIREQNLKNVGILLPYNSYTTTKKHPDVHSAYDYLRNKGFNIEAKFDFKSRPYDKYKQTKMDLDFASDNPKLMTYFSSKGLQFETVFIPKPTLWNDNDPLTPLYVAMTRTSDRLYFLYSGGEPTIFDTVPINLFKNDDEIIQL